ncbi:MAG: extracellular solute-binding protein [Christensenellales bacterium]|jgi:multiple sugar transport system substrate-binding protein
MKGSQSRISVLCLVVALAFFSILTGCHGTQELAVFSIPDTFDTTREYEITFWAKNDTNKNQTMVYEQAISDFEALYPNIKVNLRLYTDYGRIYNDVITNISTYTTPNVCITYPDHIATYKTGKNVVVPLEKLFLDAKYGLKGSDVRFDAPGKEEIVSRYFDECMIDGEYYALPFMRSTEVCYINKTYVEALGYTIPNVLTWDFVWKVSEAATEKDAQGNYKVNGQKVLIPFIYKSTDNMMITMLKQKNAGLSTPDGEVLLWNDTTRELLHTIAEHTKSGAFSTFKISGYPANFLNAGQCIFAVDSTAGSTWMGTDAPLLDISEDKLVEFETAVCLVPQFDTNNPKIISQGPSICIFNKKDSQEVLASWLFAQYLLTDRVQIDYAKTEGYVPVTIKAQTNPEYIAYLSGDEGDDAHYCVKLQATQMLIDHIEDTFITAVFNGSASLRDAAGQLIEDTVKSVRRKVTVDDAYISELYDNVIALYRLDQIGSGEIYFARKDFGRLPATAVWLLVCLAVSWMVIVVIVFSELLLKKRQTFNKD